MKIIDCSDEMMKVISNFVPEEVMSLNPVIAGGFANWLFELKGSNKTSLKSMNKFINYKQKTKDFPGSLRLIKYSSFSDVINFGDIDLWFLSDSSIWNQEDRFHALVNEETTDSEVTDAGVKSKIGAAIFFSSKANTFSSGRKYIRGKREVIQVVKNKYDSVKDILNDFDLSGCKIAVYDKKMYITDKYLASIKNEETEIDTQLWDSGMNYLDRITTANRAFKYYERTGRQISKESVNRITSIYLDMINKDIGVNNLSEIEPKKYNNARESFIGKPTVQSVASLLGILSSKNNAISTMLSKGSSSSSFITYNSIASKSSYVTKPDTISKYSKHKHTTLVGNYLTLIFQEHFEEHMLAYFINTGIASIDLITKEVIEAYPKLKIKSDTNILPIESTKW